MTTRVRYAPSPTGLQHIGGVRTALFNYFFARAQGGKFILRIEDTDQERSSEEALTDLYETLEWLGIPWDEGPIVGGPNGPYVQSERFALYKEHAEQLVAEEKAYYCYCSAERLAQVREEQQRTKSEVQGYDRHCRTLSAEERAAYEKEGIQPVIRLKVPTEGKTTFHDILMGDITRKNRDVNPDPVLLKSDGFPTYHLANVIDDHMMEITHIMRAQEWIPSGPLHIILYDAFGWEPPAYCHLPMVMGKDGQKLSKRHGSTAVKDFREEGYLPEALLNYVSLVGWSYDDKREFFTKEELEKLFCLEKISKSPGVFDYKKLQWFNGQYIRKKSDEELLELLIPYLQAAELVGKSYDTETEEQLLRLTASAKERLKVLSDIVDLSRFLFEEPSWEDPSVFAIKGVTLEEATAALQRSLGILKAGFAAGLGEEEIEEQLMALAKEELKIKVGGVFMPIRLALTGSSVSLPIFDTIALLGEERTYTRIEEALNILKKEVR